MDAQIISATQGLTTAAEMRETTQMLMQPHANWESYLTPAPLSIAIMMELVFISSVTDFSINKNPPPDGYKHIRYPESFRASLMQVCNAGWHAFNTAHKNMDQIRIYTSTVPDYMKAAVRLLFSDNDEVIKAMMPDQLETLADTANECVTLAEGVKQKYSEVIDLIQELLEACINAEHFYGEELEKLKQKVEENKLREQAAKEYNENSKKLMDAMAKQLDEAQEAYKSAMDSIPTGWELIGMDFVEGLTKIVTVFTSALINRKIGGGFEAPQQSSPQDTVSQIVACSNSEPILRLATTLKEFINDQGINWGELYDQKKKSVKTSWTKDQFNRISVDLNKRSNSTLKESALNLCNGGIAICDELNSYAPDRQWDKTKTDNMIEKTRTFYDEALKFDSWSKKMSGSASLTPKPPIMYQTGRSTANTASGRAIEQAHFKVAQSQEQLKQTRESYAKAVQNMEENQRELTEILIEMQRTNVKVIDFDTTIKMLGKGMQAMGRVKEQWEKMVQFFQMMATIVKTSLGSSINSFVKGANRTMSIPYNAKLFAKDMIYNQAFQASNIANLVHMIAGTYCEVSSKYLMDGVSKLGTLMVMDKDSNEFLVERLKLQESCKEAQEGIIQLVRANKQEFESRLDARIAQIEGGLKAVLPAVSPQETRRIEAAVQAGYAEGNIAEYA